MEKWVALWLILGFIPVIWTVLLDINKGVQTTYDMKDILFGSVVIAFGGISLAFFLLFILEIVVVEE